MKRKVKVRHPIAEDQICAVEYCKKFGEHMLATKIAKYRNNPVEANTDFVSDLMAFCDEQSDTVVI